MSQPDDIQPRAAVPTLQPWQIALIRSAGQAGLAGLAAAGTALATGVDLRAGIALVIAAVVSALGWRAGVEGRIDQSAATKARR